MRERETGLLDRKKKEKREKGTFLTEKHIKRLINRESDKGRKKKEKEKGAKDRERKKGKRDRDRQKRLSYKETEKEWR